ncbi:MAG: peptidoglycan-binding protein [bacterium]
MRIFAFKENKISGKAGSFIMAGTLLAMFFLFNVSSVSAIDLTPPEFKDLGYQASYNSQSISDPIVIEAGASKEVIVRFKNIGAKTWQASGSNYVSVYTINDKYRKSVFSSTDWLSSSHPTKISKTTKTGEIGEFKITLKAPAKTGEYKEDFYLAAENSTFIKGGYFYLKIKVVSASSKTSSSNAPSATAKTQASATQSLPNVSSNYTFTKYLYIGDKGKEVENLQNILKDLGYFTYPTITGYFGSATKEAVVKFQKKNKLSPYPGWIGPSTRSTLNLISKNSSTAAQSTTVLPSTAVTSKSGTTEPSASTPVTTNPDYSAELFAISSDEIQTEGGQRLSFATRFFNTGEKKWNGYELRENNSFVSSSLSVSNAKDMKLADDSWTTESKVIVSNDIVESNKQVKMQFFFRAPTKKGIYVARFEIMTDGHIVNGGYVEIPIIVNKDAPTNYSPPTVKLDNAKRELVDEPNIRVGLFDAEDPVKFISPFAYKIYSGKSLLGALDKNMTATISYINGKYSFESAQKSFNSDEYIRLEPFSMDNYFILPEYEREISWKGKIFFNTYRGVMEFKHSPRKDIPYVVNELPLSSYVAGIGETADNAPTEYMKAILVAARTYAYYHINNGVPADQRTFDVYASTVDQLYLGYNSEIVMPNVVKNTKATFGEMVTYEGQVVPTPYFGHSNGQTRTWKEAWGGTDKPYLKRVVCEYDKGLSMFGHGVGISMRDASLRAQDQGLNYEQILKYYYTGVELERVY